MSNSLWLHELTACQTSFTVSLSLLRLMFIESVKPSSLLVLCHSLLLLPSMFPSIRVFSNESALWISWLKYWSLKLSFNISPPNEFSGLISFNIDWFYLLVNQGTFQSPQHNTTTSINFKLTNSLSFLVVYCGKVAFLLSRSQGISSHLEMIWCHRAFLVLLCWTSCSSRVGKVFEGNLWGFLKEVKPLVVFDGECGIDLNAGSSFISQDEGMSESPVETLEKALVLRLILTGGPTSLWYLERKAEFNASKGDDAWPLLKIDRDPNIYSDFLFLESHSVVYIFIKIYPFYRLFNLVAWNYSDYSLIILFLFFLKG